MIRMLRSRFLWKLYAGYTALILVACAVIGLMIGQRVENDTQRELQRSLRAQAVFLREAATRYLKAPADPSFQQRVTDLSAEIGTRLTVIASDGTVIADSNEDPDSMENHGHRPEMEAARSSGEGTATRFSSTLRMRMMYLALPVRVDGELLGYVRTALPLAVVDERLQHQRWVIVLVAGLSALVALIVGLLLTWHSVKPIESMTQVADSMSRGDFQIRLPATRSDEIGELARALNRMARGCSERTETINADHNKLLAILSGIAEGVIAVNQAERVVHLNEAAFRLLGIRDGETLDKPVWEITHFREVREIVREVLRTQSEAERSVRVPRGSSDLFIKMHASPLRDGSGKLAGAVLVLHDVTKLRGLETVRREFVANASHELKTPITAIRGLVETLIDDREMAPAQADRFLRKIKSQSIRLSSIVTDLLALSRLEAERTEIERQDFDLRDVVLDTVKSFKALGDERHITLEAETPPDSVEFFGDEEGLCQAVSNLLDNALKYTPERGHIWVRLKQTDDQALIEVQDTGVGIEPKDQERIFERFYRVDKARSRELGGTGLGLSIVKHLCLAHGGSVTVESTSGVGSTFRILLPIKAHLSQTSTQS